MAQIAFNNNVSETTKTSPFHGNYGRNPNLFMEQQVRPQTYLALKTVESLKSVHEEARQAIDKEQLRLTASRHKDSKTAPQLKTGDKVYLLTKNLKTEKSQETGSHQDWTIFDQRGQRTIQLPIGGLQDTPSVPHFHARTCRCCNTTADNLPLPTARGRRI